MKEELGMGVTVEYIELTSFLLLETEGNAQRIFLSQDAWQKLKAFAKRTMEL